MPTYVYECSRCSGQFEIEQRMSEDPVDTCRCGSNGTVRRVIQPVGVMFKGSGFHVNDYSSRTESVDASTVAKSVDCTGDPGSCACSKPE